MKLLLKDLSDVKIDKLTINSLDRALYQAMVVVDGKEYWVWQDKHNALSTRSLAAMRKHFTGFEIAQTTLRHESAYDEMVGFAMPSAKANRMEISLRG